MRGILLIVVAAVGGAGLTGCGRAGLGPRGWTPYHPSGAYVEHRRGRVLGIGAHIVTIPTSRAGCFVTFVLAKTHGRKHLPFRTLVHKSPVTPQVAVTGTYFDGSTWAPVGEIIVDGKVLHFGGVGHALAIFPDKHAEVRRVGLNRHLPLRGIRNALRSGPRLVERGRLRSDFRAQGFHDPRVVSGRAARCGVGVRERGKEIVLLITRQRIRLTTFASMFLRLRCSDALNLDGGGSVSLFYRGRVVIHPGRELTNLLVAF